ncbi:hypothetical protein RchiOBHm_Chr5g0010381 [Rosa chinensis]|uniref:Uncharacterized protein n=1 Tax=Rosa chinensis TaxID=74649 RepID=A0A2P6Q4P9_ROSCH|nr:hypothetical protein RchiOBHm_Chr5g0010381 [Rosa chinensis]
MKKVPAPSSLEPNSVALQISRFPFHGFVVLLSTLLRFRSFISFKDGYKHQLSTEGLYERNIWCSGFCYWHS